MDRITAIRECKELWREIKASGLDKYNFFLSVKSEKWRDKHYPYNCPLCKYSHPRKSHDFVYCRKCPLELQYGATTKEERARGDYKCHVLGFFDVMMSSPRWFEAIENLKEE